MAKLNKIMPPRNTKIRGQDHLLAYITPEEAALLKARGGSGEAGPMGIPSYPEPGMGGDSDDRDGSGNSGGGSSGGGGGGGGNDDSGNDGGGGGNDGGGGSYSDLGMSPGRSQAQFGTPEFGGMTETEAYNAIGTGGASEAAQQVQADIVSQLTRAGNQGANQLTSVPYVNAQIQNLANQQLEQRMQQAKAGYGLPGPLGAGLGMLGQFNLRNIAGGIESGGRAFFGPQGQIQGVFTEGPFGFGEVYTGNAVEGYPETGYVQDAGGGDSRDPVKPVDPETGQCDEGYMFDEDMQACRLDTRSSMGDQPALPQVPFQPGGYARMGLLDEAPTNLPQFQQRYGAGFGTPSEFAAANTAFRQQGAYRPEYFKRPYPTDGYTLLG
jgi:hypothetical protein